MKYIYLSQTHLEDKKGKKYWFSIRSPSVYFCPVYQDKETLIKELLSDFEHLLRKSFEKENKIGWVDQFHTLPKFGEKYDVEKVYILLMCVDYEGDDIIEVFNSYKSVTEYINLKYPDYSVDVDNKNCYNPKINSCTSLYISEKEVLQ